MHRGTDFAAPMGTPIMASGDGVLHDGVEVWKLCKIKHNSTYQLFMLICQSLLEELNLG